MFGDLVMKKKPTSIESPSALNEINITEGARGDILVYQKQRKARSWQAGFRDLGNVQRFNTGYDKRD
jgi:hypothetical protein